MHLQRHQSNRIPGLIFATTCERCHKTLSHAAKLLRFRKGDCPRKPASWGTPGHCHRFVAADRSFFFASLPPFQPDAAR